MSSSATSVETATAVVMPQMGVSVAEGTIAGWLVAAGDEVVADQPICEVTTDKIDIEIPAPAAGVLSEILIQEGETVGVGTPLATIGGSSPPATPAGEEAPEPLDEATDPPEIDRSAFFSPVVRRMADEHDLDLSRIEGHGVGGRIRKRDLLTHLGGRSRPLHSDSPYRPDPEPVSDPDPGPAAAPGPDDLLGPVRREPLDPMRKAIATHMVESRRTAAHCTTVVEADFSAVARERSATKEEFARRGVPLTYLAFVARATVEALGEFPVLNASFDADREEIIHHEDVNLGIAVAVEDGLLVPVIRKAQRLSLEGLAAAISDLAQRAREGRLDPDDLHGGTFTITNPGQFGAVIATPIIHQPQVAILDLEAIVRRAVVVEAEDGTESIGIRPLSYLCMSWDHRALDGAISARFLARVRERLESWGVRS